MGQVTAEMLDYNWEMDLDWWVQVVNGLNIADDQVILKFWPVG